MGSQMNNPGLDAFHIFFWHQNVADAYIACAYGRGIKVCFVGFKISNFLLKILYVNLKRKTAPLPSYPTSELDVFFHDGDPLGVYGT